MKEIVRCYNCGKELKPGEVTKEHIPAKTLFEGYDEKYKKNRITVPACCECNNNYSLTDEEFRNMIGIGAKRQENNEIAHKAVRSILRKDPQHKQLVFDSLRNVLGVKICQGPIADFHKKNFKGLFYHQYGFPLPGNYELGVNMDEEDFSQFTLGIIGYLQECFEWKFSGHRDVFSYCIQPLRLDELKAKQTKKKDLELDKGENIIVGILVYNQEHAAMVFAIRKEYLEDIKFRNTKCEP